MVRTAIIGPTRRQNNVSTTPPPSPQPFETPKPIMFSPGFGLDTEDDYYHDFPSINIEHNTSDYFLQEKKRKSNPRRFEEEKEGGYIETYDITGLEDYEDSFNDTLNNNNLLDYNSSTPHENSMNIVSLNKSIESSHLNSSNNSVVNNINNNSIQVFPSYITLLLVSFSIFSNYFYKRF